MLPTADQWPAGERHQQPGAVDDEPAAQTDSQTDLTGGQLANREVRIEELSRCLLCVSPMYTHTREHAQTHAGI